MKRRAIWIGLFLVFFALTYGVLSQLRYESDKIVSGPVSMDPAPLVNQRDSEKVEHAEVSNLRRETESKPSSELEDPTEERRPSAVENKTDQTDSGASDRAPSQEAKRVSNYGGSYLYIDLTSGQIGPISEKKDMMSDFEPIFEQQELERWGIQQSQFLVAEYDSTCMIDNGMRDLEVDQCDIGGPKPLRIDFIDAGRAAPEDPSLLGYWEVRVRGQSDGPDLEPILSIRINNGFRVIGDLNRDGHPEFWSTSSAERPDQSGVNLLFVSQWRDSVLQYSAIRAVRALDLNELSFKRRPVRK